MRDLSQPVLIAYGGLVFSQLFWAGNTFVARYAADLVPPLALSFWRWLIALGLLLIVARRPLARDWPAIRARLPVIAGLAVLGLATFNTLLYVAARYTTATNIGLLTQTIPATTLLLAWLVLGERPHRQQILGVLLSFAGLTVMLTRGQPERLLALELNLGDLLILVAAGAWALYSVLLPRVAPQVHPLSLMAALVFFTAPALAPLYALEYRVTGGFALTGETLAIVAYVSVFPSILAILFWNYSVGVIGPASSAMFGYLFPIFTAALAIPLLGERLYAFHWVGGGTILAGVWFALRGGRAATRARAAALADQAGDAG